MGVERGTLALAVLALCLLAIAPMSSAHAQVPFSAGTYERWGALHDAPSSLLATGTSLLPEWITVEVAGDVATITFEPERRVVWRIRYGAHGAEEKRVRVDDEEVLVVRYERDGNGRLVRKVARGPLAPFELVWTYQTDDRGRVVGRDHVLPGPGGGTERLEVAWSPNGGASARWMVRGVERRRDVWDPRGALRETSFAGPTSASSRDRARLVYERLTSGALRRVVRVRHGHRGPAEPDARDASVTSLDVAAIAEGVVTRAEIRLLFGSPVTSVDRGRGASRELLDDYADGCWMNEVDSLSYDATGLFQRGHASCICGFCVDASLPWRAERVEGVELHWRADGWIRIDGTLVITGEHALLTPDGPRRADELVVGDPVLRADGGYRAILSIEALAPSSRQGRNVESEDGRFVAGGFVVLSEPLTTCAPRSSISAAP